MQVKMQVKVPIYILLSLITVFSTTVGAFAWTQATNGCYSRKMQMKSAKRHIQRHHHRKTDSEKYGTEVGMFPRGHFGD